MSRASSDARPEIDVLAIGDASVDFFVRVPHIARADDKAVGRLLSIQGGGMSANLAAAAAHQGARSAAIVVCGEDDYGRTELRRLGEVGVDTSGCTVAGAQSRFSVVQLDRTGEKALVGAVADVDVPALADVSDDVLRSARVVAPLADDIPWALAIARRASDLGARVVVDVEPSAVPDDDTELRELLVCTDVVFANHGTVARLTDGDFDSCAALLRNLGVGVVVLSDGASGASCYADGRAWRAQPPVVNVVDTTGAGDALAGAFVASWISGLGPATALRRAVAVSSLCVEHIGSRTYIESVPAQDSQFTRRLEGTQITEDRR